MDLKIEITKLYGLYEASRLLDHAVKEYDAGDADWRPFSPSRFVYSYFTFNSIYSFDWKSSVEQGKAFQWPPDDNGRLPKESDQVRSLIDFLCCSLVHQTPRRFSNLLKEQFDLFGIFQATMTLEHIDPSNETKRTKNLRKEFLPNFKKITDENVDVDTFSSRLKGIMSYIAKVRNNIFHGTKTRIEMLDESQQARLLIYTSILIAVNGLFFDAVNANETGWHRVPVDLRHANVGPKI